MTRVGTILHRHRIIAVALILVVVIGGMGVATLWLHAPQAKAASVNVTLLLVHGYDDTCDTAFNQTDMVPNTGPNATTTVQYLAHNWSNIDDIGYYNPDIKPFIRWDKTAGFTTDGVYGDQVSGYSHTAYGQCDHSLYYYSRTSNRSTNCISISSHPQSTLIGTTDAGIQVIACYFAWYVYDTYTTQGRPVSILAHSMGGLIVRDAIAESGNSPGFPGQRLDVRNVMTVATPHGGLTGEYLDNARSYAPSPEVEDMAANSYFMTKLLSAQFQAPQGSLGTHWALMGADIPCVPAFAGGSGSRLAACFADNSANGTQPWPDGDTVVQGESAMAMNADYKVLYGEGQMTKTTAPITADTTTQYSHASNTCQYYSAVFLKWSISQSACLTAPFYLSDGSGGNVSAWVCTSNCTSNIADFTGPPNGTAPHSLANMVAQLGVTSITVGPDGWQQSTGGSMVSGWACDDANGAATSQLDFYADAPYGQAGTHYLGGVLATLNRADLPGAGVCGGTPNHGFAFDASNAGHGQHTIWSYNIVSGTTTMMGNSGKFMVSIGQPYPTGWFQGANGSSVNGWACDDTTVANTSQIDFYADAPFGQAGTHYLGSLLATVNRPDLVGAGVCGSTPNHGFQFDASGAGSGQHTIWAYNKVSGTVTLLGNSGNVRVSNAPPKPAGWMDGANGLVVSGWACDNAFGGATSQVDFYADAPYGQAGSIYLGGYIANGSRPDLASEGICGGTPNHGFQFIAHVARGSHTIWAYNKVSSTVTLIADTVTVVNYPSCYPQSCN